MAKQQATLDKIYDESRNLGMTLTRATRKRIAQEVLGEEPPKKKISQKETLSAKCGAATEEYISMFESKAVLSRRKISNIADIIFDSLFIDSINLTSVTNDGDIINHFF